MIVLAVCLSLLPLARSTAELADADRSYRAGDYKTAAALYDGLAAAGRRSGRFYRNQGNLPLLAGGWPQTPVAYRRAEPQGAGAADFRTNLSQAHPLARQTSSPAGWART